MKCIYFARPYVGSEWGCAIVARSHNHARQIFWKNHSYEDSEHYFEVTAKVIPEFDTLAKTLPIGEMHDKLAWELHIYSCLGEHDYVDGVCRNCGELYDT